MTMDCIGMDVKIQKQSCDVLSLPHFTPRSQNCLCANRLKMVQC